MTDFGDELSQFLAGRGMSLRAAARQAGCSAGYLSNVAHGRKPLTPSVAARLDRALGTGDKFAAYALNTRQDQAVIPGSALEPAWRGSVPRDSRRHRDAAARAGDTPTVSRESALPTPWARTIAEAQRDAARLWSCDVDDRGTPADGAPSAASAVLSWLTAPPDRTAAQATGNAQVFPQDVQRMQAVRVRLKDVDNAHGGGAAFPLAAAYLRDEAAALLSGCCDEGTGAMLTAAIATSELDAGWFAYDAGDHHLARLYLIHALRMAHASGSRLLGARIICALSHQALHVGQVSLSVDLARAARAGVSLEATPRAVAMLAAMEAMAHAAARDVARCEQALGDAEQALSRATADDGDPDWLDFDDGGLLGHAARATRDLAAAGLAPPDRARQSALQSVELCRSGHSRTRAQRHAILATACVQAGDIGHAAAIGELIIADAWQLRSRHVQGDIAGLFASIEPARSREAADFTAQAREFLAARGHPPRARISQ